MKKTFLVFALTLFSCLLLTSCESIAEREILNETVIAHEVSVPENNVTIATTPPKTESATLIQIPIEKYEVITEAPVDKDPLSDTTIIIHKFKATTTDVVNFRSTPSTTEANILTTLNPGTEIFITNIESTDGFLSALLPDETSGFISEDFVDIKSNEFFNKETRDSLTLYYNENDELVNEEGFIQVIHENLISKEEFLNYIKDSCEKELVSTFTTYYSMEEIYAGKAFNINLACEEVSVVIPSGSDFNWHTIVGNTNVNEGYALANVYAGGKTVQGYGGGVCQVSTTIYGCVRQMGLTIRERHSHGMPVSYVNWYNDEDASVDDIGGFNFIFTNDKDYDILIDASTSIDETRDIKEQGVLTVNFYKLIY